MVARVWLIALLLLVSGMCALIYQVAWLREFRLVFGGSTTATAAVLAVFMGGLGLGNLLLGRFADRHPSPLQLYAQLELGIAGTAALSPWLIVAARGLNAALGGQATMGVTGATLFRLLATVLVLGLPTLLMGGTLPAAAKAVVSSHDPQRRGLGLVYGLNTLGAVVGALACTFLLLQTLGTRSTLWLACTINLALAFFAYKLAQTPLISAPEQRRDRKRRKREEPLVPAEDVPLPPAVWIYASALFVGAAFFVMELVWYRMLTPLLGGTTYSFGLILATALAGIGVGGSLYPLLYRRRAPRAWHFALTCAVQALCLAVPFALGDRFAIWSAVFLADHQQSFASAAWAWTCITAAVAFPGALVSGLQFPLLIALLGRGEEHVARQVGTAFALNTVGCILGSLLGGFGLLPLLSAPGVWRLVILGLALLAIAWLALAFRLEARLRPLWAPALAAMVALALLPVTGPTAVWRHSSIGAGRSTIHRLSGNSLIAYMHERRGWIHWEQDGIESSLAIRGPESLALYVNGKSDGNAIGDAATQIMLGMVSATVHPQPRTALVVGLGTGETAGWLGAIPEIERVDCVELEPAVVEMARRCALANHDVMNNPKVRLLFNDARETLTATPGGYDLIVSEPSNPYRAGVANLFTREFYRAVRQRLNEGGIFSQWLQGYEIDVRTAGIVLNTMRQEFPHVELWQLKDRDLLLLAAAEPIPYDVALLRSRLAREPYRNALRIAWRSHSVEGFLSGYVGGPAFVDTIVAVADEEINTDDLNQLEYAFARTVGREVNLSIMEARNQAIALEAHRPPVRGEVDWERVTDHYLLNYLADESALPFVKGLNQAQTIRWVSWNAHVRNEHDVAIETWDKQPRAPETSTELATMIASMMQQRDPRVNELLDRLERIEPIEADTLRAILAFRDEEFDVAARYCRRGLLALRDDPWPTFVQPLCQLADLISAREPKHLESLYEALSTPFAVRVRDKDRENAAMALALRIGGPTLIERLEHFEPHVPWSEKFLRLRQDTYQQANHPLAARAQRDLKRFLARENGPER